MKKELHKKFGFVLFVMAVFLAGLTLTVFREYPWMVCIAGVLLLAASVFLVLSWEKEGVSAAEKTTELLLVDRIAELMRANEKAEKGVYIAVKKQHEAMESGMEALREQVAELVKAQENAVKTVVMYNKENAKQMAMSEREELRRLCDVLKQLQTDGGETGSKASTTEAVREMSGRLYEELHENGEAMLSELETTVDSLEEMKEMLKQLCENRPIAYNMSAAQVSAAEELSEPEEMPEPELSEDLMAFYGMTEESPEEESAKEETASYEVDLSDPNRKLSADDIAALVAQAIGAGAVSDPEEIPESEVLSEPIEIPEPELSEDLISFYELTEKSPEITPASYEVDLSDPNRMLSADDIAALVAQTSAAETVSESPEIPEPVSEPMERPEPELPETPEEETPEDATASSGVDLTDPNKTLSADDIAALFASMGN